MKHNLFSRFCSLCLILALMFSLAIPAFAADEGGSSTAATGFSISLPSSFKLTLGTPGTLTAEVTAQPDGATLPDLIWTWEIQGIGSDTAPFTHTITANSMVLSPTTVGTARVTVSATATIDGKKFVRTAECLVEVGYASAAAISILPSGGVVLDVNKTQALSAYLTPSATTDAANVVWSSSVPDVVQFSATTGQQVVITGSKPGTTTLTAYSGSKSVSTTCDVTVRGVVMETDSISMTVGKTQQLAATGYEVDSSVQQWSSGNESVAIVNSTTGQVTALAVGTAVITVTMGSYSASCYVEVAENTASAITSTLEADQPLSFTSLRSQLNNICQNMLSSSLDYITNLSVSTDEGVLYYGYTSSSSTGLGVGVTERYYYTPNAVVGERGLADITFVPRSGFVGTATIYYTARSTTGATFSGVIRLTVEGGGDVTYTTSNSTPVQLEVSDFIDICRTQTSGSLHYVTFELPSSSRGTLYYKYSNSALYSEPVSADTKYRVSGIPQLSDVTFVPAEGYTGTVAIRYTGVDTAGESYSGTLTITITGNSISWDEISYQVNENGRVDFSASDFNSACRAAGGSTLSYVRFVLPDESVGTLYYDYAYNGKYDSEVSYNTRYYYKDDPSISDITFISNGELTQAIFLDCIAYDTYGSRFSFKVCIEPFTSASKDSEIHYTVYSGQAANFDADDFNEVALDLLGSRLSYVTFELPSSKLGTLYYNYHTTASKVSEASRYYRGSSLGNVSFVPASDVVDSVSIEFTGFTVDGGSFDGVVWVTVKQDEDLTITHSIKTGSTALLDSDEFNDVCLALTGSSLNYVRFTLPDSDSGILCFDYSASTGKYTSKITATTNCYRVATNSASRVLDKITFLSEEDFTGVVEIPFTGWSLSGIKFTGVLEITVTEPTARTLSYTGSSAPITLDIEDFKDVCYEMWGRELDHIRFTMLPDSSMARLYLNYSSPSLPGSAITINQNYYADTYPSLGSISLVPRADFQGSITIRYTGYDASGASYPGVVTFTISDRYCVSSYDDMAGYESAIPAVEFLSSYGVITGSNGQFNPGGYLSRADFVLMVCRAFRFNTGNLESFSDVPANSYYAWAVATAKDLGIVQGNGTLFFPQGVLTREDAILMLQRAINIAGLDVPTASTYLLNYYTDGDQVSNYARQAVATLVNAGIVTANDLGQLQPKTPIRRADVAVMLHRVLTY